MLQLPTPHLPVRDCAPGACSLLPATVPPALASVVASLPSFTLLKSVGGAERVTVAGVQCISLCGSELSALYAAASKPPPPVLVQLRCQHGHALGIDVQVVPTSRRAITQAFLRDQPSLLLQLNSPAALPARQHGVSWSAASNTSSSKMKAPAAVSGDKRDRDGQATSTPRGGGGGGGSVNGGGGE
jgi:hypothetical protein